MSQLHLSRVLSQALRDHGGRTAALCGSQSFTYAQAYQHALRLANGLRGLGVAKVDRGAVLMLNCHRYLDTTSGPTARWKRGVSRHLKFPTFRHLKFPTVT